LFIKDDLKWGEVLADTNATKICYMEGYSNLEEKQFGNIVE